MKNKYIYFRMTTSVSPDMFHVALAIEKFNSRFNFADEFDVETVNVQTLLDEVLFKLSNNKYTQEQSKKIASIMLGIDCASAVTYGLKHTCMIKNLYTIKRLDKN
jgi:hypothetical protein